MTTKPVLCAFLLLCASYVCLARDVRTVAPPFPRIANCYGSGLSWQTWEQGRDYWGKLDLFIGGGYDLHYDWENERWPGALARIEENVAHLREVNPTALVLPYVDVIEGPDNPNIPQAWWDLRDGQRWSGWPGMFRIDTSLPEVLQFNLDRVRGEVLGRDCFDGVFYDCWGPDEWLVPKTAELREGDAIVMINEWNLPRAGFADLNGCLAEDELNRVVEGIVDFEEFLARYLKWSSESRKPVTTTLVCHPRNMNMDPWHWDKVPWQERRDYADSLRDSDPQMVRFGLTTTLLGDGYFGYDCANLGRGQWWWYPEFDAPLGYPKGPAERRADGLWQRQFDGGLVVVNGTLYDAEVTLDANADDISTHRVGTQFTLRSFDGRIFIPSDAAPTPGDDSPPGITAAPPTSLRTATLDDGSVVAQTPKGLELRFSPSGELRVIRHGGATVMRGGWPIAALQPFRTMEARDSRPPEVSSTPEEASLRFAGTLAGDERSVSYEETCTVQPDNRLTLAFRFTAETDLDLRMWRHYFLFPVSDYAGRRATAGTQTIVLPAELGEPELLPASQEFQIDAEGGTIRIDSSFPMSLVDHRKWGTQDYLLAGYPVSGAVKAGTAWEVAMTVEVR